MLKNINFLLVLSLLFGIYLAGCNKEPEKIGLDLVNENQLNTYDTVFSVTGYSIIEDSVQTDETSINILGSMYSENFGLTVASFFAQPRLVDLSPDFGDEAHVDSAFLTLVYSGSYGNFTTPQRIRIYEVAEDFYKDSAYYSRDRFDIFSNEFADFTFVPNPVDSVPVNDSTKVPAEIKIPLNESFYNKIVFPADDSVLSSNANFLNYFKGLYITADSVSMAGEGALLYFGLLASRSKITIYYNDSLTYGLTFTSNSARVGNFHHNYAKSLNQNFKTQVLNHLDTVGAGNLYLQGLAGIKTFISIPSLAGWINTKKYSINDAKLIIPIYNNDENFTPASDLLLFKLDEDGTQVLPEDYFEGERYFGGGLNNSVNKYEFRLSFQIQDVINGTPDYGYELVISGKTTRANEVLLYGTEPGGPDLSRIRLNVVYTKIP